MERNMIFPFNLSQKIKKLDITHINFNLKPDGE